jgi:23S rRNA (cytosine1962-C5)-methyltransferase
MVESKMYQTVRLKPGKETTVQQRHPWIFSGALVAPLDVSQHGRVVKVVDSRDVVLGVGTWSNSSTIAVRVFEFDDTIIDTDWLVRRIRAANERRLHVGLGPGTQTTGYRVVFGESDGIPGLIIDRYDSAVVLQLSTAGLEQMRAMILDAVRQVFDPAVIVERSDLSVRKDDGLAEYSAVHLWNGPGPITFLENGIKYQADLVNGQKTGFYLDQRDLRQTVRALASGRRVLNLFSYTGSMGVAALLGSAMEVLNVDSSVVALEQCTINAQLNGLPRHKMQTEAEDIFQWLTRHSDPAWNMVIVDPPSLIKSHRHTEAGRKAYHFLFRAALRLVVDGGYLVCSSCSQFLVPEDMTTTLRRASVQCNSHLFPVKSLGHPSDHPVTVYFPEAEYLKSVVSLVERPDIAAIS